MYIIIFKAECYTNNNISFTSASKACRIAGSFTLQLPHLTLAHKYCLLFHTFGPRLQLLQLAPLSEGSSTIRHPVDACGRSTSVPHINIKGFRLFINMTCVNCTVSVFDQWNWSTVLVAVHSTTVHTLHRMVDRSLKSSR